MKNYSVKMPFAGFVTVYVEAESEEAAKVAANKVLDNVGLDRKELIKK